MSSSFDIIIVNWNAGDQLRACLASVARDKRQLDLRRVVVIDNASGDDSLDGLDDLGLPLTIIRNQENRGFGAACNQGSEACDSDRLLFLNPDTRVHPGALAGAMACLDGGEDRRVGIVGVQLVDEHGQAQRSCARFPSLPRLLNEMLGLSTLLPKYCHGLFMREWDHHFNRQVDHVMGAFTLTRRSLFESLQGFDETFFMYFEDLDFSIRARQAGWNSFYLADAQVYHKGGGTSDQVRARRLFYLLRSRFRYARKHLGLARTWVIVAVTFSVELPLRVIQAFAMRSASRARETLEGYLMLSKDLLKEVAGR